MAMGMNTKRTHETSYSVGSHVSGNHVDMLGHSVASMS